MAYQKQRSLPSNNMDAIPGFLAKLWNLINDEKSNDNICWSPDGKSFFIIDGNVLAKEILPFYFKHNNLASFIRQLNMYGFHRTSRTDTANPKLELSGLMEFVHPSFQREHPELLAGITRRSADEKHGYGKSTDDMRHVLTAVNKLKNKQTTTEQEMSQLREQNHQLWLELRYLRQQHRQQQQAVRYLLNFFSYALKNRDGPTSLKRRAPIAIEASNDENPLPAKVAKTGTNQQRQEPLTIEEVSDRHSPDILDLLKDFSPSPLPSGYGIDKTEPRILVLDPPSLQNDDLSSLNDSSSGFELPFLSGDNDLLPSESDQQLPMYINLEFSKQTPEFINVTSSSSCSPTYRDSLSSSVENSYNELSDIKDMMTDTDLNFDPDAFMNIIYNLEKPISIDENLLNMYDDEKSNPAPVTSVCSTVPSATNAIVSYNDNNTMRLSTSPQGGSSAFFRP